MKKCTKSLRARINSKLKAPAYAEASVGRQRSKLKSPSNSEALAGKQSAKAFIPD